MYRWRRRGCWPRLPRGCHGRRAETVPEKIRWRTAQLRSVLGSNVPELERLIDYTGKEPAGAVVQCVPAGVALWLSSDPDPPAGLDRQSCGERPVDVNDRRQRRDILSQSIPSHLRATSSTVIVSAMPSTVTIWPSLSKLRRVAGRGHGWDGDDRRVRQETTDIPGLPAGEHHLDRLQDEPQSSWALRRSESRTDCLAGLERLTSTVEIAVSPQVAGCDHGGPTA
jgi:hypothetical protein